jgi:hypothetical protein
MKMLILKDQSDPICFVVGEASSRSDVVNEALILQPLLQLQVPRQLL